MKFLVRRVFGGVMNMVHNNFSIPPFALGVVNLWWAKSSVTKGPAYGSNGLRPAHHNNLISLVSFPSAQMILIQYLGPTEYSAKQKNLKSISSNLKFLIFRAAEYSIKEATEDREFYLFKPIRHYKITARTIIMGFDVQNPASRIAHGNLFSLSSENSFTWNMNR